MDKRRWGHEILAHAFIPRHFHLFNVSFFRAWWQRLLNDYTYSRAYSYHKSGRLQPQLYHNLTGSDFTILKGECRKSQSVDDPFHKLWIILEKSAKIWLYQCTCMAGMGERCNHVAAAMF